MEGGRLYKGCGRRSLVFMSLFPSMCVVTRHKSVTVAHILRDANDCNCPGPNEIELRIGGHGFSKVCCGCLPVSRLSFIISSCMF